MTPTEEEVREAVDQVWEDVIALAEAPGGLALMQAAMDAYVGHEE